MAELIIEGGAASTEMTGQPNSTFMQNTITENEPKLESDEKQTPNNENPGTVCVVVTRFPCPECTRYTTNTEEKLQRHIRKVHRGENPFQCFMCDYSTYNKAVFEEHVRVHKGIKPFKCSHCDYASASKKNARKHEAIHRPDNPLRCQECGFISRHPKGLLAHKKNKHGDVSQSLERKDYIRHRDYDDRRKVCECCNKKLTIRAYQNHKKSVKSCKICHVKVCTKKLMLEHLSNMHGQEKLDETLVLFQCAFCSWSSNNKMRILLHLIHHPNQEVSKDIDLSILRKLGIVK